MTFVPLQLPQLLDVTTMEEAQFYGDYALLTFPLRDPYDLEEVMDLFEDDMELITLLATARAVQRIPDAHCNGDMHAAIDYAAKIKHAQKDFLTSQGIHAIID